MSGIIGPLTPGRIALALGTIGVGALVGGAVADHNDGDVGRGALIGGLSAAAGIALLAGGSYAWNRFAAGRAGAASGASQLGSSLARFTTPAAAAPASTIATQAASASATLARAPMLPSLAALPTLTAHALPAPSSLFRPMPALATTVPAIARTPLLPVASLATSGGTFVDALRAFIR